MVSGMFIRNCVIALSAFDNFLSINHALHIYIYTYDFFSITNFNECNIQQSGDYNRFKKDTILTSLNYINARRASKPFDERTNCIWGIEDMCYLTSVIPKRNLAEKKHVFKVIREEQARQKKEWQQKQKKRSENDNNADLQRRIPDLEKFRSVSVGHSKAGRDRAITRGTEYARSVQRSLGVGGTRSSSRKNLFASFRTQSALAA